jgi:hypothetical protein
VLAGVLILGTAISEIWLSLDSAGRWLFGSYGAAAAIALLGALTFHLAFTAELPPPPPKPLKPLKPLKPKNQTRRRGRGKGSDGETSDPAEADETDDAPAPVSAAAVETTQATEVTETTAADEATEVNELGAPANVDEADDDRADNDEESAGRLRNRRPSGKSLFRRSRGGVALED